MNDLQHIRSMAEMIIQKVDALTDNNVGRNRHGGPFDRGSADACYNRPVNPHWYPEGTYIGTKITQDKMSPTEIADYCAGYGSVKKPEPKFKVGDKVVWLSDCSETPMTVTSVCIDTFNTGNPTVVFPNESGIYYEYWVDLGYGNNKWVFGEAALKLYVEPEVEDRVWHSGPPPHIGWWNASIEQDHGVWRWWDGKCWSIMVIDTEDSSDANIWAKQRDQCQQGIQWTDYYPENARVPRINPGV